MSRRVPFNASQFLKRKLPTSAYGFDMQHGDGGDFAEGHFGGVDEFHTSPAQLVNQGEPISYEEFLANWRNFIRGMSDNIAFHLLTNEEGVAEKFSVNLHAPKVIAAIDDANEHMNPKLLFKALGITPEQLNTAIDKHYHFDAQKTVDKLDELLKVLRAPENENNKIIRGKVVRAAPQLLRDSQAIHKAIEAYQIEAEVESSAHYHKMADAMNAQLNIVIENLEERIEKGTPVKGR